MKDILGASLSAILTFGTLHKKEIEGPLAVDFYFFFGLGIFPLKNNAMKFNSSSKQKSKCLKSQVGTTFVKPIRTVMVLTTRVDPAFLKDIWFSQKGGPPSGSAYGQTGRHEILDNLSINPRNP